MRIGYQWREGGPGSVLLHVKMREKLHTSSRTRYCGVSFIPYLSPNSMYHHRNLHIAIVFELHHLTPSHHEQPSSLHHGRNMLKPPSR